ncbi:MAG: response regulator [Flavobacteriales bacterium]
MSLNRKISFHLVDDNDIDIAVNTKLLQLMGLTDTIYTYGGGLKFLEELKQLGEKFNSQHNIILLDIMMPMANGFDCLEQLQQLSEGDKKRIDVFMLSSTIDRNDIMRAEGYPMVRKVLEKPLDIYLLKRCIEEMYP